MCRSFAGVFATILALAAPAAVNSQMPESRPPSRAEATPARVTLGPVERSVSTSSVMIVWSTNVSTDTTLRYGTDPAHLDQIEREHFGGLTHRVLLTHLNPQTIYYFRVVVPMELTKGREAMAEVASFRTRARGQEPAD